MAVELNKLYTKRKKEIQRRLREFQDVPPEEYFYEMVYCLLTPQTSALNAEKAVHTLKQHRYRECNFDPLPFLHANDYYIRFHHTKAKRLKDLKKVFHRANEVLSDSSVNAFERREILISIIDGYGLKEATHFLRNIGKNDGLAILDRHILRNLYKYGAIDNLPSNLSKNKYYQIEEQFRFFADSIHIPLDELDLLFWSLETGIILK